jgi:hypothetical protein
MLGNSQVCTEAGRLIAVDDRDSRLDCSRSYVSHSKSRRVSVAINTSSLR